MSSRKRCREEPKTPVRDNAPPSSQREVSPPYMLPTEDTFIRSETLDETADGGSPISKRRKVSGAVRPTLERVQNCEAFKGYTEWVSVEMVLRMSAEDGTEEHFLVRSYHRWISHDNGDKKSTHSAFDELSFSELDLTFVAIKDMPELIIKFIKDLIELETLECFLIPPNSYRPRYDPSLTIAPEKMLKDCYLKRTMLSFDPNNQDETSAEIILGEAKVCEKLIKNPHENVVQYWGCYVVDNQIRGLVFEKYTMTLLQHVQTGYSINMESCVRSIESGILHLHSLGINHNDINPSNIMMDASDNPILIDFDSSCPSGEVLVKGGQPDWSPDDLKYSCQANDYYGLFKIQQWLYREMNKREKELREESGKVEELEN
ncbi:kinase-like domain-containing protein [Fusarium avenaceum]|nr:kinase-like domain-containing protein [Fusarium avenaceum]